ncbi:hsp70 nucleotide exchange factor fes1, partial [Coemansia sp. RSA 1836]
MDSLLKWAILNTATAGEDAPHDASRVAPQKLDPAVIDAILGKPASVQMTECMDAVEHKETPTAARIIALDDLEMLVGNIDNASNVEPLRLWPRLGTLYHDADAGVRAGALWVSATALQHNQRAQAAFARHALLAPALALVEGDGDEAVRAKALLCVSAFVRANPAGLAEFVAAGGLALLRRVMDAAPAPHAQRILFLLGALVDEALDDATPETLDDATPETLRPAARLPAAIADLGFVDAAAAAVLRFAGDAAVFGRVTAFLASLAATPDGRAAVRASAALRQVVDQARASADPEDVATLD